MSPTGVKQLFSPQTPQLFSPQGAQQPSMMSPLMSPSFRQGGHPSLAGPSGMSPFSPSFQTRPGMQPTLPQPSNPGPLSALQRSRTTDDLHHMMHDHAHAAHHQPMTPRGRAYSNATPHTGTQTGHADHKHEPLGVFKQGFGGAGTHVLTHAHSKALEHKQQALTPQAAQAVFQIRSLLNLGKRAKGHDQIANILRALDNVSLNGALNAIGIDNLLASTRDSRIRSKHRARSALVEFLGSERVRSLNFDNQVDLVHAIQNHGKKNAADLNAVRHVFLNNTGSNLTRLKTACDMNGGSDLTDLMHNYLEGNAQSAVFAHIHAQGRVHANSPCKILSDVDDTLYSSMFDSSFPKGTVYPGLLELYHSLDIGPSEDESKEGNIVFLTARPGFLQNSTFDKLKNLGVKRSAVLMGAMSHLIGNERIAGKKYENYTRFKELYPEFRFVWFGDTSQGDAILGGDMLMDSDGKAHVAGVFIHDMVDKSGKYRTSPSERADFARRGIMIFDSYVAVAAECYRRGLISAGAVQRICESAQGEMLEINWESTQQRQARMTELHQGVQACQAALTGAGTPRTGAPRTPRRSF